LGDGRDLLQSEIRKKALLLPYLRALAYSTHHSSEVKSQKPEARFNFLLLPSCFTGFEIII
jgi:hypothetical protein